MEETKNITDQSNKPKEQNDVQKVLIVNPEEVKVKVCDVCGYVNPFDAPLCKKCSNYLF